MDYITRSTKETEKVAIGLAITLRKGNAVALYGDLGSGKTTFTNFLVKALGLNARVQSPTFVIARKYKSDSLEVNHVDLYRLTSADEIKDIGIEEILKEKGAITVIEWPELVEEFLPKNTIRIKFEYIDENSRKISIHNLY